MKDVNVVCLSGHLTRDPELRALTSGGSVCNMSIAVNESYKSGDEWKERANFFDITVWAGQGENAARYLSKGSRVMIQGRLQQQTWETQDGGKRSKVVVVADLVLFPPQRRDDQAASPQAPADPADDFRDIDLGGDDLPF